MMAGPRSLLMAIHYLCSSDDVRELLEWSADQISEWVRLAKENLLDSRHWFSRCCFYSASKGTAGNARLRFDIELFRCSKVGMTQQISHSAHIARIVHRP